MNRSITFAATSFSALLLVAATLAAPASAENVDRNIEIQKKKFTVQTDNAAQDSAEVTLPVDKTKFKTFTVDDGAASQEATSDTPIKPKAFTIDDEDEAAANPPPQLDDIAEEAPRPPKKIKKFPKVLQIVDEDQAPAPLKPKLKDATPSVDAAASDDVEDDDAEVATKKVEEETTEVTADVSDADDATPTFSKKMRVRYSPKLRRYVEVTAEDLANENSAYETAGYEDQSNDDSGYETPSYSYKHRYSYTPSCQQ